MSAATLSRPHTALQASVKSSALLPAPTRVVVSGRSRPACGARQASHSLPSQALQRNRRPLTEPPAAASGLSAYPLMELRRGAYSSGRGLGGAMGSHAWLSACVRHIVTTAGATEQPGSQAGGAAAGSAAASSAGGGRGASLHLVFSGPSGHSHSFQTLPLSRTVADNPQHWDEIAATVSRTGANGLVLVRPIPSPDQHCVFAAAAGAAAAAAVAPSPASTASESPCYSSSCCSPSAACSPNGQLLPPPPGPTNSMEGQVGDCCGGSGSSGHSHPHSHERSSRSSSTCPPGSAQAAAPAGLPGFCCPHTQYWGVVVQGATPSDTDGCWVLKTSRSDAGSSGPAHGVCMCTHFTLTRVCGGTPLYSQLRDAWLVPQQQQEPAVTGKQYAQTQPVRQQRWH